MESVAIHQRHLIPGAVAIDAGSGGLPRLLLTSPQATAELYLHGAHVTQFTPKGGPPTLFLSKASYFAQTKPIRGGVPLIFPWFGPNAQNSTLPAHGFARTRAWNLLSTRKAANGEVTAELGLRSTPETLQLWPHDFALTFSVVVGGTLRMSLQVQNTGSQAFRFEEAFHTYLAVSDVRNVKIDGLGGREFLDKTDGGSRKMQRESPFGIVGETDRVYLDTRDTVIVTDPAGSSAGGPAILSVSKEDSAATVVWNPWIAKSVAMADFGDHEWPGMLCIETANAAGNALTLPPGESHTMTAEIARL